MSEAFVDDPWGRNYLTIENIDSVATLLRDLLGGKVVAVVTTVEEFIGFRTIATGLPFTDNPEESITVVHNQGTVGKSEQPSAQLKIRIQGHQWQFSASLKEDVGVTTTKITFGEEYVTFSRFITLGGAEGSIYDRKTYEHILLIIQRDNAS